MVTMNKINNLLAVTALAGIMALSHGALAQTGKTKKAVHHSASHARISESQAVKSALRKYLGAVVGKAKLENEEGKWQYAVNIRTKKSLMEVMVDARTGKIASAEKTSKAEEAAEAKADAAKAHKGAKSGGTAGH
jgi:hypothetical protein